MKNYSLEYSIGEFQSYVLDRYRSRDSTWPGARTLIQDVARHLVSRLGADSLPVDPLRAAALLRIEVADDSTAKQNSVASLTIKRDRLVLDVHRGTRKSSELTREERFAVAHECGHSLFYTNSGIEYSRLVPIGADSRSKAYNREEGLCNQFAGALLIPAEYSEYISVRKPSPWALLALSDVFGTSGEVTIYRIQRDFTLWRNSVFYKINRIGSGVGIIGPFRGENRRKSADLAPSISVMRSRFASMSFGEVVQALKLDSEPLAKGVASRQHYAWIQM